MIEIDKPKERSIKSYYQFFLLRSLQDSAAAFELFIALFPIHIRAILALGALRRL